MSDTLPQYYRKADGDDGVFKLVMLASYDIDGDPKQNRALYVCKHLGGGLNEAFSSKDLAEKRWLVDYDYHMKTDEILGKLTGRNEQ